MPKPALSQRPPHRGASAVDAGDRRSPVYQLIRVLLLAFVAFNVVIFLWLLMSSFKDSRAIFGSPWTLPTTWHIENYVSAWLSSEIATDARNSVLVVTVSAAAIVALSAPAAYALSRFGVRGSGWLTTYMALGMGIPVQAAIIPIFVGLAKVGLLDSLTGLILLYVATSLPFTVFFLTAFFRTLPPELEEAAALDGASPLRTFLRVMLPLARPGIVTVLLLNVIALWNETFLALVLIGDTANYTLSLGLLGMYGTMQYTSNWGGLFAGVCIVVLPMLVLYVVLSRRIIEGMTVGASR
ncbi:MAG TPA: carbohydrate ABC transporter permease [Jiangellales bacterium]|nr:carbohydrate ABC transporter permease [Jiangellales bacterium]